MSSAFGSNLDAYSLKARFLPALIVILPAWLAFSLWFPPDRAFQGVFASAGVTVVLTALLAQIGRDAGKNRQKELFKAWGGQPTVRALSFRSRVINHTTVARCHEALNAIVPALDLPVSKEEEAKDIATAKVKYESAADFLRSVTRDKEAFRLVYAENVNYGFRRNLWALKPGGIAIVSLSLATSVGHACLLYLKSATLAGLDAASILLCLAFFACWIFRFTKTWVRLAADAYSSQLVLASESLKKQP